MVPTVTVIGCAALPLICTEAIDNPQVGAGLIIGLTLQLRFTAPVNDPVGVTTKLNFALCPALMVWEVDDPDAAPTLKFGAATPAPDRATVCGLPAALSANVTLPARLLIPVGVNVTEISQLLPAAKDALQVFVSPKSPEAAIRVKVSA